MGDTTMTTAVITKMDWWEIPVADLDDARRFYGEVMGWGFTPFGEDYFAATGPDGALLGGIFLATPDDKGNGVRITFTADDLEGALERVRAAGGAVLNERTEIPGDGMGWWADFTDPAGRRIGFSTTNPAA